MAVGAVALGALGVVAGPAQARRASRRCSTPNCSAHPNFRIGISQQMLQQITLGGAMIALPLFLQMALEYDAMQAGLSLAPLSLSMFAVALLAGKRAGDRRPSQHRAGRVPAPPRRRRGAHPARAPGRLGLVRWSSR